MKLPTGLRDRKLTGPQARFVNELYCAKESFVRFPDLLDAVYQGVGDRYKISRLAHETRRVIQGTGWHIESKPRYGYRMVWMARNAPDLEPEALELLRDTGSDLRALRADFAMFADQMRGMMAEIVTVPTHMLLPLDTWTPEIDEAILATQGITGKLSIVASEAQLPDEAVISRLKALRAAG